MPKNELKEKTEIKKDLYFRIDTPAFLKELVECSMHEHSGVMSQPLNIFRNYLIKISERAIQLNDPILNQIMFDMNLYKLPNDQKKYLEIMEQVYKLADKQRKKENKNADERK